MTTLISSHVAVACKDPITFERFYAKYFGFKRARVIPLADEQIVFIKSGSTYIEIFPAKGESPPPPAEGDGPQFPGWRHLAFQVADVDALIVKMGHDADITRGPLDFDDVIPGWRTVWVSDPERNIVEISQGYADEDNSPPLEG